MDATITTISETPKILEVQGLLGRFADMRTRWLEEAPGLYVALDADGQPASDQFGHRTEIYADGDTWAARIWSAGRGRFVSTDLADALRRITQSLHE